MKLSILTLVALVLGTQAFASPITVDEIDAPQGLTIKMNGNQNLVLPGGSNVTEAILSQGNSKSVTNKTFDHSSNVQHRISGTWDFSAVGGAAGTYALGMTVPAGALIEKAWIDVITAPNTSTGSPTIAIGSSVAGDILAATTYSNLTAGLSVGKEGAGSTDALKLASALRVSPTSAAVNLVIAAANLSVGKIRVFLDYLDESN